MDGKPGSSGSNRITERNKYQRQQREKKAWEEVKGVGNKGGGSDGSGDVTMCKNLKDVLELPIQQFPVILLPDRAS